MRELREDTLSENKNEDAHDHVDRILNIVTLFNIPRVSKDAVLLRVFTFTLTGAAKRWVDRLTPGSDNTWDLVKKAFIQRYCPPSKTAKRLEDIHNFMQESNESLYQPWERKRRAFWSLNEDILKITILKTNTPYPSRKIRRIRACTHQRPQRNKDQYVVSRGLNTPYSRYGINIIFWKISSVVPTPRNPQYAVSNSWIRRTTSRLRPYHFTYPERELTMEEILHKFIDEGKREHKEMSAFINDLKTTNEILFKERDNSLIELRFEVQKLLRIIESPPTSNCEIKRVTTRGGKMTTQDVQKDDTNMNGEEPPEEACDKPVESNEILMENQPQGTNAPIVLEKLKEVEDLATYHLSRFENPHMEVLTEREITNKFSDDHLMVLKSKFKDDEPWYADFVNYIVRKVIPPNWTFKKRKRFYSQVKTYFWEEPYAFKLCADHIIRRCVAGSETLEILAHYHSGLTGGHHSANVTTKKVYEAGFYWPSVFKDANEYVRRCDACQRSGNISSRNEMPQNNIQVCEVFDVWGIDFMGPFPQSKGNKYILVPVDYVSKWVKAQTLPTNDARVVVKFLRSLLARFGVPKALISDRGTHFCNSQLEKALQRYGMTHKLSMVYHPQSNVQTEVTNKAIKCILERSMGYNPKGWSKKHNAALWAFRMAYKTPIGCTPFRLVYGKSCHLPVEIEHKAHWALKQCNMNLTLASESRLMQLNELAKLRDGAYENTRIYKERTKKWHDSRLRGDKDLR
ncbi:reverse transcriptase domain-containing protein [Tanacetum coccineum]